MEPKATAKKVVRPAARLFSKAVVQVIGTRLSALEEAHGRTWHELQLVRARLADVIEARLAALELADGAALSDFQRIEAYIPAVLDATSSQHAITRAAIRTERQLSRQSDEHARRLDEIERRIEFVRRELLFEARYGGRSQGIGVSGPDEVATPVAVEPKVLNEAKLRSFGDDIRLNLGAGHIPAEGFLNVDARDLDGIDIRADIRSLPFEPCQVSVISCAHLLEHFPVEEVRRLLLPYWFSLLKPGGRIVVVVPDAEAMLAGYAQGDVSFSDLREVTFGGQEYDGDFHFNMYSKESITALLTGAGFIDAVVTVSARRNGLCYEMQAEAVRPDDGGTAG